MFRSIIVPTDGSRFAEQALPLAEEIAQRARAGIELALVHQAPAMPIADVSGRAYEALDRQTREHELEYLKRLERRLEAKGIDCLGSALLSGPVADALQTEIEQRGIGLVIMSTHGRGGLGRMWLGSVADRLLHSIGIPLLLVRPAADSRATAPTTIKRVLVPLDGSELAEIVLESVIGIAALFGAEVDLVRVVPPALYAIPALEMPVVYDPKLDALLHREASDYLAAVGAKLRSQGVRVATAVEVNLSVAQAVLERAQGHAETMIALATHGRTGSRKVLLGSVADKLVRGASCPVLVCRSRTAGRAGIRAEEGHVA